LIIKLNIISDNIYKVEENYIQKKIKIPLNKFIIGGQIHFSHPRGKGEFHLSESSQPGMKKIFPNLVSDYILFYFKMFLEIDIKNNLNIRVYQNTMIMKKKKM